MLSLKLTDPLFLPSRELTAPIFWCSLLQLRAAVWQWVAILVPECPPPPGTTPTPTHGHPTPPPCTASPTAGEDNALLTRRIGLFLFSLFIFFHCHMSLFLSVLDIQNVHFIAMCLSVPGLRRMECSRVPTWILFSNSYGFAVSSMTYRKFSLRQFQWFATILYTKKDLAEISSFEEIIWKFRNIRYLCNQGIYNLSIQIPCVLENISKIPCVFIDSDSFWPFSLVFFFFLFLFELFLKWKVYSLPTGENRYSQV